MTTIAHSTLTGSDLHEPKGVATAGNGTIYVANGLGSGTWTTISAQQGAVKQVNYYSASATITIPSGCTAARVCMWGASGGGGGMAQQNAFVGGVPGGGGGGSGGYCESYFTGMTPGNTLIYTRGNAGGGGSATPGVGNSGGAGGTTTLTSGTQTIATMTCGGGGGGAGSGSTGGTIIVGGGGGGSASGGNIISLPGNVGGDGYNLQSNNSLSGYAGLGGKAGTLGLAQGGGGAGAGGGPTSGSPGQNNGILIIYWMS